MDKSRKGQVKLSGTFELSNHKIMEYKKIDAVKDGALTGVGS
jgi:limonene-1,2-epoxide hydrolase